MPDIACWFTTLPQSWFGDGAPPAEDGPPPAHELERLREWARTGTSPWAGGYDAAKFGGSILEAIAAAGADGWFPYHRDASEGAVAQARALGLKVGVWTVDDPSAMAAMLARGVDAVCTDRPDLLAAEIRNSSPG